VAERTLGGGPRTAALPPPARLALLAALLLVTAGAPQAATYRIGPSLTVSDSDFSDLERFAQRVACLRAGDKVLLQRGATLHGALHLRLCGDVGRDAGGLIEIGVFDVKGRSAETSTMTTLTGAERAAGWMRMSASQARLLAPRLANGITLYRLDSGAGDVAEIFVDGNRMLLARDPNVEQGTPRYTTIDRLASSGPNCSAALCLRSGDEAPAAMAAAVADPLPKVGRPYAIVRSSPWSLAYSRVQGMDRGSRDLLLSDPVHGPTEPTNVLPRPGYGYLLVNHVALLDGHGEWFHDRAKRVLLLAWDDKKHGALDTQDTLLVRDRATSAERLMFQGAGIALWADPKTAAGSALKVRISGIQVQRTAGDGIRVLNVPHVEVVDVGILQAALHGIVVHGAAESATVRGTRINGTPGNGIQVSASPFVVLEDNRISRAGQIANQERLGMDFNGIRVGGFREVSVLRNEIDTTGFAGIMMSEAIPISDDQPQALTVQVRDNTISTFCVHFNDCGAIYINGRRRGRPDLKVVEGTRVVQGNRIMDPRATLNGLPGNTQAAYSSVANGMTHRMVGAIYLDHGASGYDVVDNRVQGHYEPYGWRIFNKGVLNGCSRKDVEACITSNGGYKCYTPALDRCNEVVPPR
jgi:Right handed beta helix region